MQVVWSVAAVAVALALALTCWMVLVEPRLFRVRRVLLDSGQVGLPPLRILHVTDTHFHGRDAAMLAFLRKLSAQEQFDLVLLTGDLIDTPAGVASAAEAVRLFAPRLGTFAVLGGHDYAEINLVRAYTHLLFRKPQMAYANANPAGELVRQLEGAGCRVLDDAAAMVQAPDGARFAMVGLRDSYVFEPDYEAAWAGAAPDTPAVVIAHCPDVLPEVVRRGARLALFGHTHGGQVRLPLVGAVLTRSRLPRRLARGAFRAEDTVFVLNHGLGASPVLPYRLLCRPEVTVAVVAEGASPEALTRTPEARIE